MILIKNAKIPVPEKRIFTGDLLFDNKKGEIVSIASKTEYEGAEKIDAKGDYLLPLFTDLYTRVTPPDSLESTALCARWGGYGTLLTLSEENKTDGYEGFYSPSELNVTVLESESTLDSRQLRALMKKTADEEKLLIASPQRDPAYPESCLAEGRTATLLKLPCEPSFIEACSVYKYVSLAKETGCRLHIRGISTQESVNIIKNAKKEKIKVSCSTSPHYFSFTDEDTVFIGANSKVYPPLRSTKDKEGIICGIADGTIDCIDSDHTPTEDKGFDIRRAPYGAIGLQTVFPALCTYLLMPGYIDVFRLCELLCANPSKILGFKRPGYLTEGKASFVRASVTEDFILTKSNLISNAKNSPYVGMSLCGNIKNVF